MTDGNDSKLMVFGLPDDVCKCQCMWLSLAIHHHHHLLVVLLGRPVKILHLQCSVKSSGDVLFSHLSKPSTAFLSSTSLALLFPSPSFLHIPPLFSSYLYNLFIFSQISFHISPHGAFVVLLILCFVVCQALNPDISCSTVPVLC